MGKLSLGTYRQPIHHQVIDSMTTDWDGNLDTAIADWNQSSVMNVVEEAGDSTQRVRKQCRPVSGKVRACNANYGFNGWLGVAQIWISGSHITQGTAKMNDSYLSSGYTEVNRQHVICQEIGHDWGLGHQDESGADLNTCMDYANALDNQHPDAHDYAQLESIYAHLDSTTTIAATPPGFANADVHAQENWGEKVSDNGKSALFVRDFGNDFKIFTFVIWAE
jgi:predicted Zn-dependent protease